jgi:hypothetical protein
MIENSKKVVVELKDSFIKTLYQLTTAFELNISSFLVFLELFSFSSLVFLLFTFCVLGLCFLCF